MNSHKHKIIVLGWDSATWDLVDPWIEDGKLPHLSRLIDDGCRGTIKSTPLPVSPAAWSTVLTGQNPGKHGVFDWFERKAGSYDIEYVHTGRIAAKPIWEYFGERAKRIGIFNLPMIYPAVPINGFMISGLAAPSPHAAGFSFPEELIDELESNLGPYRSAEPQVFKHGRESEYLQCMLEWVDYQEEVIRYLIANDRCDLFFFVFVQSDHAHHKFWKYQDTKFPGYDQNYDSRFEDSVLKIYQSLDQMLGRLRQEHADNTTFVVLSDHGAGPLHGVMYVNRWLIREGLLYLHKSPLTRLKALLAKTDIILKLYRLIARFGLGNIAKLVSKPARNTILSSFLTFEDVDWSRTKAYSRGSFGQIYINLKGREPNGIVSSGEDYQAIVSEIMERLRSLRHPDSGELLISDLHHRTEIYDGDFVEHAADINFSIQDYLYQSSVKFEGQGDSILGPSEYEDTGSHRPDGLIVLAGPHIKQGKTISPSSLEDVTPTLLGLANIPIPQHIDGRPLTEAFTDDLNDKLRFVDNEKTGQESVVAPEMNSEEKEELENRLRNLGYLG